MTRCSLIVPPPESEVALDHLHRAAHALLGADTAAARTAVVLADRAKLREWFIFVQRPRQLFPTLGLDPRIQRSGSGCVQQPDAPQSMRNRIFHRDGWRCRWCGVRVVNPEARRVLSDAAGLQWERRNEKRHGGMLARCASHDHVLPRSWGGDSGEENLVTACWPCQFSRMNARLEDCGLEDPRGRPPVCDDWDGLTQLVAWSKQTAGTRAGAAASR